ncbi:hypothetical protein GCM10028792_20990 [Salinisphaera aquimarina]
MAGRGVVDHAVVAKEMKESAGRIDTGRVIKRHRPAYVVHQKIRRAEIGDGYVDVIHGARVPGQIIVRWFNEAAPAVNTAATEGDRMAPLATGVVYFIYL